MLLYFIYKGVINLIKTPEDWNRVDDNNNLIPFDAFVNLHCHSYFSLNV